MAKEITAKKQSFIKVYNLLPALPSAKAQFDFAKFIDFRRTLKGAIADYLDFTQERKDKIADIRETYFKENIKDIQEEFVDLKAIKNRKPEQEQRMQEIGGLLQGAENKVLLLSEPFEIEIQEEFKAQTEKIKWVFDQEDFNFVKDLFINNLASLVNSKESERMNLELADELESFFAQETPNKTK